ncbi:hypothetical protein VE03_08729 [Pseudogymnoascus sp. 23342-1-I1]|nr:hypothetical protein VE03_08729 [Pseudogymnoascus sp. 23342-1-I1]
MASLEPSSPHLSLITLPAEIHAAILTHLRFFDLHTLRFTNRYFHALIPPPTHADLLSAETLESGLLACVGCTRLRPIANFSPNMFIKKKMPRGAQAHNRFCIECGHRPLPGVHRYTLGSRWRENGVPFVRCLRCEIIAEGLEDQTVRTCPSCHTQNLETVRAAEELERVRRETRLRGERRARRAERRRNWIKRGLPGSDFSSADPSDQDDSDDEWERGQDGGINYFGHW